MTITEAVNILINEVNSGTPIESLFQCYIQMYPKSCEWIFFEYCRVTGKYDKFD